MPFKLTYIVHIRLIESPNLDICMICCSSEKHIILLVTHSMNTHFKITQSLKELQSIMSDYVGIVRTDVRLQRAMKRLDLLYEETEELYRSTKVSPQLCELRNLITVAYLIVKGASFRKESRGLHYNTDHPTKSVILQDVIL